MTCKILKILTKQNLIIIIFGVILRKREKEKEKEKKKKKERKKKDIVGGERNWW